MSPIRHPRPPVATLGWNWLAEHPASEATTRWTRREARRARTSCGVHTLEAAACRNCGGRTLPLTELEPARTKPA
jgi:rRNA maturation protein Nop10